MIAANSSLDWDDVRVFLAVARHGSLRAAGRALGLSQPTIGRRLATFEATFGGPTLFDRLPEGLRLNAAGDALMPAAEELESAALALERRRAAASPALSGAVRVSVGEWGGAFLARHLDQSSETGLPPTLTLELVESWETANLARRDADLALRHGVPEGGNLYVSKVGVIACAVYCRCDGRVHDPLRGAAWVTYPGGWISSCGPRGETWRCGLRPCRCGLPQCGPGLAWGYCHVFSATPILRSIGLPGRCRNSGPNIG